MQQESLKPNFIISTIAILNEILSKIQGYDDLCVYTHGISKGKNSFYKSNPSAMQHVILNNQNYLPFSPLDFHNQKKDTQLSSKIEGLEGENAVEIDIKERISMLEKFKIVSPNTEPTMKQTFYPHKNSSLSQESEEEETKYKPFNIMRNSRAERMEKFEEKAFTPRAPYNMNKEEH